MVWVNWGGRRPRGYRGGPFGGGYGGYNRGYNGVATTAAGGGGGGGCLRDVFLVETGCCLAEMLGCGPQLLLVAPAAASLLVAPRSGTAPRAEQLIRLYQTRISAKRTAPVLPDDALLLRVRDRGASRARHAARPAPHRRPHPALPAGRVERPGPGAARSTLDLDPRQHGHALVGEVLHGAQRRPRGRRRTPWRRRRASGRRGKLGTSPTTTPPTSSSRARGRRCRRSRVKTPACRP